MSELRRYLVGYDPSTEEVAVEFPVSPVQFTTARRFVDAGRADPEMLSCYDLNRDQAERIAEVIQLGHLPPRLDYFLEAVVEGDA